MQKDWSRNRTEVSLREYVQEKIDSLAALLRAEAKGTEKALKLQAKEYSRRLNELNHAHEQRLEHDKEYINIEKFESFQSEFRQYKETTQTALTLATGMKGGQTNTIKIIVGAFGFVLTCLWIVQTGITILVAVFSFYAFNREPKSIQPVQITAPIPLYSPAPTPSPK